MFFTTIEEWVALLIMIPFCILCGYISAKLTLRDREKNQAEYDRIKKAHQCSDLKHGLNIIKLDKKDINNER